MWGKTLATSLGLLCLGGLVSCDRVQGLLDGFVGETVAEDRRVGIERVHEASAADVAQWLAEPNVLVVLDFYSDNCPPCKAMDPHLKAMATKYADKAAVLKLNVGKPGDVATMAIDEYKIESTPVLKFFLNGKEVKELRGGQPVEAIEEVFVKYTEGIDGELTVREGDMPGSGAQRSAEDMMVRAKKGELPAGMTRVKVPKGSKEVTEAKMKGLFGGPTEAKPDAGATQKSQPTTKSTKKTMTSTERAQAASLGKLKSS